MLKWAKTKSAFKDQKNVKDAKTFTDLTPTKQKVITRQYEARLQRKAVKKEAKKAKPKKKEPEKPKLTAAQIRAKEYRENFRYDVGDKVSFQTGRNEKAKVIAGTIEALTDKGVVMRANKGEVEKSVNRGFNFSVTYTWRPTEGTQKKVVSWGRVKGVEEYTGKSVSLGTVGG